jgi:ElaB/YqjD/DUF883 family membrane-anchored ribosome-binding protein
MGEEPGNVGAVAAGAANDGASGQKSAAELRREIEQTREELGETAAALGAKADVKSRARERVDEIKQNVSDKKDEFTHKASDAAPSGAGEAATQLRSTAQSNPMPTAAIGAMLIGFALGRLSAKR